MSEDKWEENKKFLVGLPVITKYCVSDFCCFNAGEKGVVVKNDGGYLSIIVLFETGLTWNFNANHLELR